MDRRRQRRVLEEEAKEGVYEMKERSGAGGGVKESKWENKAGWKKGRRVLEDGEIEGKRW